TYKHTINTTANLSQRDLIVTFGGIDRVYDATTAASVTKADNRVSGDDITVTYRSPAFADKKVGTNKPLTVTEIKVIGPDFGNYAYKTEASTTASITPYTLIVNFAGVNRVYDGTRVAAVTESDNHFAGDDVTVSNGGAYFDDKNVGTAKRVTVIGINIGGVDAGNYTYSFSAASAAKR